jgi:hypothetical protein
MARFELSGQTDAIVRLLQPFEKGTEVTYREITRLLGFVVTPRSSRLAYARTVLQRDHNAVWVCIRPGIGLKRLNDVEIATRLPEWWLNGARNKLSRGSAQADVVELSRLSTDEQVRFSVAGIQGHLATETLSRVSQRRLEKVARGNSNDLPTFNAVEWAISLMSRKDKR